MYKYLFMIVSSSYISLYMYNCLHPYVF